MKISGTRYGTVLVLQMILLTVDMIINASTEFLRNQIMVQLGLFVFQIVGIIMALLAMLLTFFTTYVFQVGLMSLLVERFRCTIILITVYFFLTTVRHISYLATYWLHPTKDEGGALVSTLTMLHRLVSAFYYYCYKRAALRIADPRFYEDIQWFDTEHGRPAAQ